MEIRQKFSNEGLSRFLFLSVISATIGMFQFGYNTGVINAPQKVIQEFINDVYISRSGSPINANTNNLLWSIAVSIFAIGGMVGGLSGGFFANRLGRKLAMVINAGLGIVGGLIMGLSKSAHSFEVLIVGRFIIGANCGVSTSLSPMYISEISPVRFRGALGVINQLAVTIGLMTSQILGIEEILGNNNGWPYLLGITIAPFVLQLVLLMMCSESPRFLLLHKGENVKAQEVLQKLRNKSDVQDEVDEMIRESQDSRLVTHVSVLQLLSSASLRLPLMIAVVMQLSQQLSGINAVSSEPRFNFPIGPQVFYYSSVTFRSAGLSEVDAGHATIGVGGIMVVMTIVSIPLMERQGRRKLHLVGLGGMFLMSILITIFLSLRNAYDSEHGTVTRISVIWVLGFVVFFAIGPGSIPWLITAELFGQGPRPAAISIATLVNWLANFIIGIAFLHLQVRTFSSFFLQTALQALLQELSFLPFTVLLLLFFVFTYRKVPETKNLTFEQVSKLFKKQSENDLSDQGK